MAKTKSNISTVMFEKIRRDTHARRVSSWATRQTNVSTIDRDRLVRAILPIFHHPYIKAPMRILRCEEVEKLAGLHNHFDRVHAHRSLLTELTVKTIAAIASILSIFKRL